MKFSLAKKSISLFIIVFGFVLYGLYIRKPVVSLVQETTYQTPQQIAINPVPVYTGIRDIATEEASFSASISATAVYAYDLDSGSSLLELAVAEPRFPASTIKMLTALVSRDTYELDQPLPVKKAQPIGTNLGLLPGEVYTTASLLQALLIESSNDAAFVLADNHPGGYDGFVLAMQQKASQLHLNSTFPTNPAGLDNGQQLTTAQDLTILAKALLQDEFLRELVAMPTTVVTDAQGKRAFTLRNTNQLLADERIHGIKTGTTDAARESLVLLVQEGGHSFIISILGSEQRYIDAHRVMTWIADHYHWQEVN